MSGPDTSSRGFADLLRERTRALHTRAERSGVVADLLQGRASRFGYTLLLRNLLPAYERLEDGIELHRATPGLAPLAERAVYRATAIESDLLALCGPEWPRSLPLLGSGERYADRVTQAAADDGARLLAHAYARFLGDLNGGQILSRLLRRSLALDPSALAFYAYPGIADLAAFRNGYREALDRAAAFVDTGPVVEEALAAFEHNIEVAQEVQQTATRERAATPNP